MRVLIAICLFSACDKGSSAIEEAQRQNEAELAKAKTKVDRPITIGYLQGFSQTEQAATVMANGLRKLGLETKLTSELWPTMVERMKKPDTSPDLVVYWISTYYADPHNWIGEMFHSGQWGTFKASSFYKNPKVDELLDTALKSTDRKARESQARFRCRACAYTGNADVNAALRLPDVIESLNAQGLAVAGGEPEPLGERAPAERSKRMKAPAEKYRRQPGESLQESTPADRLGRRGSIAISMFGAANGITLTAPRAYFAMARDGMFFRRAAAVHPRYKTPAASILARQLGTRHAGGRGCDDHERGGGCSRSRSRERVCTRVGGIARRRDSDPSCVHGAVPRH